MSKNKTDALTSVVEPTPSDVVMTVGGVVFLDQVYTSRTLILPDGRAASVANGRITASDDTLLGFLSQHSDFKQAE
ncbi:hypothetical protein IFR35_09660 [Pseudomonas fluorescens]|uniref:hypothetical protein n=1 Tax=Pseudomonas fluorescens TaxID=294 RepID=UPI00177C62EE|nr:hypothetical protein [Pseudomonas fluorescens]MBD8192135.1 hypothetical protein [Pseudomonas fluorescens]MBD8226759.1 hypothetical protein [Pseudomonas fluorescens]MBD8784472.1 hypothetical protein [Pseudomonas fluorescens]MBD8817152.1 hypothetical protein [Pseudomonas fluorescens]